MEEPRDSLDRRRFVLQSAGVFAGLGSLGSLGSLEGLRAALARATIQKPILSERSVNALLAEAKTAEQRQRLARAVSADLDGFLYKHFEVEKEGPCARLLATLSEEEMATITQAVQEGLTGRNQIRVEVADMDLQTVTDPKVIVERANTAGDDAQLTTINITPCGYCER